VEQKLKNSTFEIAQNHLMSHDKLYTVNFSGMANLDVFLHLGPRIPWLTLLFISI
jgi:hypothetical protein